MLDGKADRFLAEQLLRIAQDPDLRRDIYERLGDYCHQCRNRLNSLKLSLYLAMRQSVGSPEEAWGELDRHYQELERRVNRVQAICRPMALSRVRLGLDLLIDDRLDAWSRKAAAGGLAIEVVPPVERAIASFDVDWMGKALDALVAWRSDGGPVDRSASLRWWVESGTAHLMWSEPAHESSERDPLAGDGPTWNYPLIARVVLAHGGDFQMKEDFGWSLEVSWPSPTVP